MKPVIDIISLGGTIAMTPDGRAAGAIPNLSADDLIAAVPQLSQVAQIRAQTFLNIPSAHLTFKDLDALAAQIQSHVENGAQGIVITQGTDTIEETSYALDLMLEIKVPIVVTGAMRNPSRPGADGPANLLGAVQVASSEVARSLGVLVVFNDEIHAARFVQKTHTSNVATFRSDPLGPIGWLAEDRVRILVNLPHNLPIVPINAPTSVKVPIIKIGLGDDETMIEAAVSAKVDGLIIEATGGGHVPQSIANALANICQRLPVILTSRTGLGEALTSTYGFPGAEIDLLQKGLIPGGRLDGCKARILLCLLLRHCKGDRGRDDPGQSDLEVIRQEFSYRGSGIDCQ